MPDDEVALSGIKRELAALDERVHAMQRDAVMAITAITAAVALLALLRGWTMI